MNKAEIKNNVLTENTAQSVYNHLQTLLKTPDSIYRWVWELLQNARDASESPNTLTASINYRSEELVFLHNGHGFKEKEIGHLIFHGSTKTEEEGKIGQYGSGFLTTHLLSWAIDVSGQLDDGRCFDFCLERKPDSEVALRESMDEAWNNFNPSSSPIYDDDFTTDDGFTTRFTYPIRTEEARKAVEEGIAMLRECAPFVVVFNPEFSGININIDTTDCSEELCFKVLERNPLEASGIEQITVAESNSELRKYLLAKGDKVSVTVLNNDNLECLPVEELPRLFLGFPLVGTKSFSFPAVINSFGFSATPNREGVWLAKDGDEATLENRSIIEEACELLVDLVGYAASKKWKHVHQWVKIPPIENPNWLDANWLRDCIRDDLIEKIRETDVVLNADNNAIAPKVSHLPILEDGKGVEVLWDLLKNLQGADEKLPRRIEATGWCNSLQSWGGIYDQAVSVFDEAFDGRRLAQYVHNVSHDTDVKPKTHRISRLNLKEGVVAIHWLDSLIDFLRKNGLDGVIRQYWIVPSQEGFLRPLDRLDRDPGIDDNLKDIAELLNWRLRCELRDSRLNSLTGEEGRGDMDIDDVLTDLCHKLGDRADGNPDSNFREASKRLFAWIVNQEDWARLRNFPVFRKESKSTNSVVLHLPNLSAGDPPLAPLRAWSKDLEPFSELFPLDRILADDFFQVMPKLDLWKQLDKQNLIKSENVIRNCDTDVVDFRLFSPEVYENEEDEGNHESEISFSATEVVEWDAIMDRVRNSQERGPLFWRFITEYVIKKDSAGLEEGGAKCKSCGKCHKYYPAAWLRAVRSNKWIRQGDLRFRADASSLAKLLRNKWQLSSLNENPDVVKLLKVLDISQSDLRLEFVAEDKEKRDEVINLATTLYDRPQLVHHIQTNENLPDNLERIVEVTGGDLGQVVEDAEKRQKQQREMNENQDLGKKVEEWVGESLEEKGFNVNPVHTGADFEIDLTTLDVNQGEQKWWIEVKSARTESVKMSSKQTQNALDKGEDFLLCVVPISEDGPLNPEVVKSNMRFIKNIREKLGDRVARLCQSIENQEMVHDKIPDDTPSGIDLDFEAGKAEIHVKNSVWEDENEAFPLGNLAENLK